MYAPWVMPAASGVLCAYGVLLARWAWISPTSRAYRAARRAGSAAVTAVVIVATGGMPPEGSVPTNQTTPKGGTNA